MRRALLFIGACLFSGCRLPPPVEPEVGIAAPALFQGHDLEEFVRRFNYWSDRGLYSREDLKAEAEREAREAGGSFNFTDMPGHGREIEELLSPRCKVLTEIDGSRVTASRAEFVSSIQRSRFMWQAKEGLLDGPHFRVGEHTAFVTMRKFDLDPQKPDSAYIYDCGLAIKIEDDRPVITEMARTYRKASSDEVVELPGKPYFVHPRTPGKPLLLKSEEEFKRSMEAIPPRPPDLADIERLARKLQDEGNTKPGSRALAAYRLGSYGAGARSAIPTLVEALADGDRNVRRSAAEALGKMGPDARIAVPALKALLDDESGDVRYHATWALERLERGQP